MKKNPQMPSARRILGMVVGIVIIGLGIALFKQSHLGNDSISALNMRLAEMLGISLGVQNLCTNILFFALQFWFGRKYIGLGTFVNGIGVGFIVTAFYDPIAAHFGPAEALGLPVQLLWVALAVPVTALGASLYQTADLGIAPYDYLSLGLRDYTPVPYFGCRVFTDALCAVLAFLLGGLIGLGTLICAFGLGPFVQFFTRHFSEKVLRYKPEKKEKHRRAGCPRRPGSAPAAAALLRASSARPCDALFRQAAGACGLGGRRGGFYIRPRSLALHL